MEQWIRWKPLENLAATHKIEMIHDTSVGLQIVLVAQANTPKLSILFKNVCAYKTEIESYRLNTFYTLTERYGKEFYTTWTFFKIHQSSYLKEVCSIINLSDHQDIQHFVIMGQESMVDVLTSSEPIVSYIKEEKNS